MKPRGEALSQQEIEELLATLPLEQSAEDIGAAAPMHPASTGRQIRTWDFKKPDKFSKDHMRSLLALQQNFARMASTALAARLRTNITIRVTSVDQGLYEEYIELLPQETVVNVVSLRPLEGNIMFEFQPELAMIMIDRLLGGGGSTVDPSHEMTDIELALIRNLDRTLLESMREAWVNLAEVEPNIEEIATSPQLVQVASARDIVVIVLLEVQVGERLGTISMCIPHLVIEPLMQKLSAQVWVVSNRRRPATPEMRAQITGGLRRATLRLTAVLGQTAITVQDILHMQEGDVLLLGGGALGQVRLKVADQHKFTGTPGLVGSRVALKITEVEGDDRGDE
jgi:flagellar motor switch protein FliM